ncbi:sirohydrochlorin chelatase [Metabacillus sp. GX 13764]|uniref:sirohydrochlorin chelatase n=1 Tax=Metabacillus kandeliae TaxID=2900151 RepID=UPI001E3E012C|nr:sirohydrochlorin chelatase [Metabacillus kandeliae]MCD7033848.1 sirohydrochlorin chelatase [Metabacillus kandeliae]
MSQAVLYICHGSRVKKAREEAAAFIQECQKSIAAPIQEISFLELAEPSIEEGFAACVNKGATSIAVVPLLLLTAVHAKKDIPEVLERMQQQYPSVPISYGRPIGIQDKMAEAVYSMLKPHTYSNADTRVLIIGRGSTDPEVKENMQRLAGMLKEKYRFKETDVCYLTAAKPSFEEKLSEINTFPENHILLMPYLLFTGLLMKGIEKEIRKLQTEKNLVLCSYIGHSPLVREAFVYRVKEAIEQKPGVFSMEESV